MKKKLTLTEKMDLINEWTAEGSIIVFDSGNSEMTAPNEPACINGNQIQININHTEEIE